VIDGNAYIGCENKNWSAFGRRSDHHFSGELHLFGSQHKADRGRAPLVEIELAASGYRQLGLGTRARMLRGKSKVNTLAVNAACGVRGAKHSTSRVVPSLKVKTLFADLPLRILRGVP